VSELDRALAATAATQHSLLSLADVVAAGGSVDHAKRRVQSGRWERVARGVYRIAGTPWTYEAEVLAAVLSAGPGAVASHLCAARLLGLGFRTAGPELSIPRGRRHRPTSLRTHESTDLDRCDVQLVVGIPVTDPGRTVLDLGRYLRAPSLLRAAETARRLELVTWRGLLHTLLAHARQGRHGITTLREVVTHGLLRDGVTDTDSELLALSLVREHGLPPPVLHHQVRDPTGEIVAEIDLAWVGPKAAIEIDGEVHNDPSVRSKDDARDAHLRRLGWSVRRVWKGVPLDEPRRFVQIVRTALRDRGLNV
jgi:very-short-patch-repair endonuclease